MKKILGVLLVILLFIINMNPCFASALLNEVSSFNPQGYTSVEIVTQGDFIYSVYSDSNGDVTEVWLTGYTGSGGSVTVPNSIEYNSAAVNVTVIGDSVFKDRNIASVEIPNGITWICSGAFENNELINVVLPSTIEGIGSEAFKNNDLTSVSLPSSLKGLSVTAFDGNVVKQVVTPAGGMLNKSLFYQFFTNVDRDTTTPAWFTDEGYTFPITDDSFGSGLTYYNGGEATVYTITYNTDGGDNHEDNPTSYTVIDDNITLNPASKTGYTCENWYSTTDDTYGNTITTTDMENKTFTANYLPNNYTISFRAVTATGSVVSASEDGGTADVTATFDEAYPATIDGSASEENSWQGDPLIAPSRSGDEFLGYYKEPFAGGTKVYDHTMTAVVDVFNTAEDVSLFAGYRNTSNKALVSFYENGGSEVDDIVTDKGSQIGEPIPPAKDGFTFDGWYKDTDFENVWDFANDTVSSNITLYAKWIYIENNNNSSSPGSSSSGSNAAKQVEDAVTITESKKGENTQIIVNQEDVTVEFNGEAFKNLENKIVQVKIGEVGIDDLNISKELKEQIGDLPVFDISVYVEGEKTNFESDEPIVIEIQVDTNYPDHKVIAVYIDENGNAQIMEGVLKDGVMKFVTNHLSEYALMYVDKSFDDVTTHWGKEAIVALAIREVVNGVGNNMFNPDGETTRAEFATIMVRYFDLPSTSSEKFADAMDKWYEDYALAAKTNGILPEIYGDTFDGEKAITREEMMYILYKCLEQSDRLDTLDDNGDKLSDFTDGDMVSSYAVEGSDYLVSRDVINGSGDGKFNPTSTSTRAEVAQMMWNMINMTK